MLLGAVLAAVAAISSASPPPLLRGLLGKRSASLSSSCATTGTPSCTNTTVVPNTCCFEAPGGLLVLTQFWDFNPTTGPSNSWTIHGLWPDHCDGTFDSNCDPSRDYTNIGSLLTSQGASDTLAFMQTYWKNINGNDEQLWEHEWATHGTCMSTLHTSCLPAGSPTGAEAVAFYQTVVRLFKKYDVYDSLAAAGITPSTSATYSLSTLQSALRTAFGVTPALYCSSGSLNQAFVYFHLQGSVIDGVFNPINAPIAGSCGSSGITYPPKSGSPVITTTTTGTNPTTTTTTGTTPTTTTTTATPTGTSIPSRIQVQSLTSSGSFVGGLLTAGTWSTQTLATMTLSGTTSGFTMTSSKGPCNVISGALTCGSTVTAGTFTAVTDSSGNLLVSYNGITTWSSAGVPSGTTVYPVFADATHAQTYSLVI